jgi:hypothetical protein
MKKKILIASNLYQIDPIVYSSHLQMFYRFGRESELDIIFYAPWRVPIDVARNNAAAIALANECDYLFFYDDDMYFENGQDAVDLVKKVIDSNDKIHILQGLAFIRGYPFKPMMFKFRNIDNERKQLLPVDDYKDNVDENGLIKVDAVGCCATVIDTKLFKLTPKPWFQTGTQNTEDIYFCVKCCEYIQGVGIYVDPSKKIGHLLDKLVLIEANRDTLRSIHEGYDLNQLFLPDKNFVPVIKRSKTMMYDSDERANPLNPLESKLMFKEKTDE